MNILMMTNTYLPFTGGVPRSIDTFARQFRKLGHVVKIVAPTFEGQEEDPDVIRVPAIRHFNGTEFSVHLPAPFFLSEFIEAFQPHVIHSHHPFLLGNTALRLATRHEVPLVYTFHTFYEHYAHYMPGGETEAIKRFVVKLVVGYANLCDHVIAPSHSVAEEILRRHVNKPIDVIPTGVNADVIGKGNGEAFREKHDIPREAFVVGFVSRLAKEKNLPFLCDAVLDFLSQNDKAWFVVAGAGPLEDEVKTRLSRSGALQRMVMLGNLEGPGLTDLYHAMDVFAFASLTETQGLVVAEAMAAGTPVVALQAPGVGDVVRDTFNGRLLEGENEKEFSAALAWLAGRNAEERSALRVNALETARTFSDEVCARKLLALYEGARRETKALHEHQSAWDEFMATVSTEWNLLVNLGAAAGEALGDPELETEKPSFNQISENR